MLSEIEPGLVDPETFGTVVAEGEVADACAFVVVDLGGVEQDETALEGCGVGGGGLGGGDGDGGEGFVEGGGGVAAEGFEIDGDAGSEGVGEVFVEGARESGGEGKSGVADGAVVDVVAEGEGKDEGVGIRGDLFFDGAMDFGDGGVSGIDGETADFVVGAAEADGSVFEAEVDEMDVARRGVREMTEEGFVFFATHGGDVGEAVVLVDEVGVGEGSVEAAGEAG